MQQHDINVRFMNRAKSGCSSITRLETNSNVENVIPQGQRGKTKGTYIYAGVATESLRERLYYI